MRFEKLSDGFNHLLEDQYTYVDIPVNVSTMHIALLNGTLTVLAGFMWDGASGPTIDSQATRRAALFHDALYSLIRKGLIPQEYKVDADKLLRDLMLEDKQTPFGFFRAWYYYAGVRVFGGSSCKLEEGCRPP